MCKQTSVLFLAIALTTGVCGCAESEPQTVEVTREVEVSQTVEVPQTVEVTREVTEIVEKVVEETVEVVVTPTPRPTSQATKAASESAPTAASAQGPVGTVRVDHWLLEISEVRSDPGMDASRQNLILLGNLTNEGTQTDGFVALHTIVLRDSTGRTYEEDPVITMAAVDRYGAELSVGMSPGATEPIAIGYDVPASERAFTLVPGNLASSWSGNVSFTIP